MDERKKILVVDDEPTNLQLMRQILKDEYRLQFANSGEAAVRAAIDNVPDMILLDIMMPDMSGIDVCKLVRANARTRDIPVIFITAMNEIEHEERGFDAGGVDYILKPITPSILKRRVATHLELANMDMMRETRAETIQMLGEAGHYNDSDTGNHIWRMASYAATLARASGWSKERAEELRLAAPMHDTGKIGISDSILKAPRKLTQEEFDIVKTHTYIGWNILNKSNSPLLKMAAELALYHHEKWDGTGYPEGLSGEAIPEVARIVAIADVFDALTMRRPYKKKWSIDDALAYIRNQAGQHFDPGLARVFIDIQDEIIRLKSYWDNKE